MAYGRKTGGRQKGTPNRIRGAFAREVIADLKRRGVDLVRELNDAFIASRDVETAPAPHRTRYLFAMLRFVQIAERAEAAEADALAEAQAGAPAKPAASVTTAQAPSPQPIDKAVSISKVEKSGSAFRAALLASTSLFALAGVTGLPGFPAGAKPASLHDILPGLG
jgi:hypothetical protein